MAIDRTTLNQIAVQVAGTQPNHYRLFQDILDRLEVAEAAIGSVGEDESSLATRVATAEGDIDTLEEHAPLRFIGSQSAFSVTAVAKDSFINLPDGLHNLDVYLVLGDINGRFSQLIEGAEIAGLTAAGVGDTLVTTAGSETGIPLYATNNATDAALALIGKTAAGDVLIQGAAADATSVLVMYRVTGG